MIYEVFFKERFKGIIDFNGSFGNIFSSLKIDSSFNVYIELYLRNQYLGLLFY